MKKYFLFSIAVAVCVSFLTQCKKKGEKLGSYSFSSQDLNITPYHSIGQKFILTDSLGDSIRYKVISLWSYINHVTNEAHLTPETVPYEDYYDVEVLSITIEGYCNISIGFSSPFDPPVEKYLTVNVLGIDSHPDLGEIKGFCGFESGKLYQVNKINNNDPAYNVKNFEVEIYDTLKICNSNFYSAFGLTKSFPSGDTTDGIKTLYYTINQGIVGIKTNKNRRWRLI